MLVVIVMVSEPGMIPTLILLFFFQKIAPELFLFLFLLWLNILKEVRGRKREAETRPPFCRGCLTERTWFRENIFSPPWTWALPTWNASVHGPISVGISIPAAHLGDKWRRRKPRELGPEKGGKQTAKLEGRFLQWSFGRDEGSWRGKSTQPENYLLHSSEGARRGARELECV